MDTIALLYGFRSVVFSASEIISSINNSRQTSHVIFDAASKRVGLATGGSFGESGLSVIATLPQMYPEWLGGRGFQEAHHIRFPYVGGAMARGIASADMVIELGRCGMLGIFGAAGIHLGRLEQELSKISRALDPEGLSWGSNLIHTPNRPQQEEETIDLYLKMGVRRISASAYMQLSPAIVRYACSGLKKDANGLICRQNRVIAKISRPEVSELFMRPAPNAMLQTLVASGQLSEEEAGLAKHIPIAEDITVEADSGGHTDNRPLGVLFPSIAQQRDRICKETGFTLRLGAAGGLGTPDAIASAFAMGAAYVTIGTAHQTCVEAGVADDVRKMLADATLADTAMAASADMFEQGVKVQVLKRGTMMAMRANQLYQLYRNHNSIEELPQAIRKRLEEQVFRMSLNAVWEEVKRFFTTAEPEQLVRAQGDPKHKMALIFRWYLGSSSHWPIDGKKDRQTDYQIWCGPAIGPFNAWVKDTFLEDIDQRTVKQVALNLMEGACVCWRAQQLRSFGASIPPLNTIYRPQRLEVNHV